MCLNVRIVTSLPSTWAFIQLNTETYARSNLSHSYNPPTYTTILKAWITLYDHV